MNREEKDPLFQSEDWKEALRICGLIPRQQESQVALIPVSFQLEGEEGIGGSSIARVLRLEVGSSTHVSASFAHHSPALLVKAPSRGSITCIYSMFIATI
jgi:hypothetical protein